MGKPLMPSGSNSSDYYEQDDPEFLEALHAAVLPGDTLEDVQAQVALPEPEPEEDSEDDSDDMYYPPRRRKRKRSQPPEDLGEAQIRGAQPETENKTESSHDQDESNTVIYGASRFGHWDEYMRRKRMKLQIQNAQFDQGEGPSQPRSKIFEGVAIYINGWTEPSVQDLRQLTVQHGGIFHAYLDKKSLVTHIITCSLTPAKVREFKNMKVVRPEWLVESVKAGVLLPWTDYIFKPDGRIEVAQGAKTAQKSLADGFTTQASLSKPSTSLPPRKNSGTSCTIPDDVFLKCEGESASQAVSPRPTNGKPSRQLSPPLELHTTDPISFEQAAYVPGYAAHVSNPLASRAMENPEWRAAHTSVAPDFIEGFYKNSRLHHLSAWKAELKGLVAEAQERAENGVLSAVTDAAHGEADDPVGRIVSENTVGCNGVIQMNDVSMRGAELVMRSPSKGKGKEKMVDGDRVIMHCDFDCFFVSAGLVSRPHLRGKPIVVCHSQSGQGGGASTSEIASASYEAREFGIKNGMSLQQARKLCPTVMTIPYEFERYKQFSLQFYTILMSHADDVQAVSVDEALIDVTSSVARINVACSQNPSSSPADPAKQFAEAIRTQVKKATGCEVSIGIGQNILLARLATRRAKPAGSYHLVPKDLPDFIETLGISDLHGFGWSARQKAREKLGTTKLGELAKKTKSVLIDALGKGTGETLYNALRGIDDRKLESDKPRKSVSCEINYGIRFWDNEQAETFVYQLAEEVSRRLISIKVRGGSLTLKIMKRDPDAPVEPPKFLGHGACDTFNKQIPLAGPYGKATNDAKVIGEHAWNLLKSHNFDPKELRGIGIQIQKLESSVNIAVEPGQARLPFKPKESMDRPELVADLAMPEITVQPPSQDREPHDEAYGKGSNGLHAGNTEEAPIFDIPSYSQVDQSVLGALPQDVRQELEAEYRRRSHSPAIAADGSPVKLKGVRSVSAGAPQVWPRKITVKGTGNVKRITQQLAPRSRASISPKKSTLFTARSSGNGLQIPDFELRKLNLDPEVFALLPIDLQREQLSMARVARAPGGPNVLLPPAGARKVLKPYTRQARPIPRRPPPKARYVEPAVLKQRGPRKGEKLYFSETADVQDVIQKWVDGFKETPPNPKDVEFFAKWLVQCVDAERSSDQGVEKALKVTKWWLILLRRYFGIWEASEVSNNDHAISCSPSTVTNIPQEVGKAWWKAFRDVKARMDAVARKKFGGSLSIR